MKPFEVTLFLGMEPSINDILLKTFRSPPPTPHPALSIYVLNLSTLSNRTSLIDTIPSTLTEKIFFYLRHSLQGNILSASSYDIHVYSTKSSGSKIYPHQSY